MNSLIYLAVALGGALGACTRYGVSVWVSKWFTGAFPLATILVNVVGGFIIGIMFILFTEKQLLPELMKPLIITGFLGGLTTFSTFSLESVNLIMKGEYLLAGTYVVSSVVLCLLACIGAILLARLI